MLLSYMSTSNNAVNANPHRLYFDVGTIKLSAWTHARMSVCFQVYFSQFTWRIWYSTKGNCPFHLKCMATTFSLCFIHFWNIYHSGYRHIWNNKNHVFTVLWLLWMWCLNLMLDAVVLLFWINQERWKLFNQSFFIVDLTRCLFRVLFLMYPLYNMNI